MKSKYCFRWKEWATILDSEDLFDGPHTILLLVAWHRMIMADLCGCGGPTQWPFQDQWDRCGIFLEASEFLEMLNKS